MNGLDRRTPFERIILLVSLVMSLRIGPVVWFLSLLILFTADSSAQEKEKTKLTPAQRKESGEILSEFRKLKPGDERRLETIDRAAKVGTPAIKSLLEAAEKELHKPLVQYRTKFARAALKAFAAKLNRNSAAEIEQLRATVLAQSKAPELSKEDIKRVSDPALERLKSLLLAQTEEAFAQDTTLEKQRSQLITLAAEWDRCRAKWYEIEPPQPVAGAEAEAGEPPLFADYLKHEEELAVFEIMPIDPAAKAVLAENAQLAARLDPEEVRCIQQCNLIRCLLGLSAVKIDLRLCAASRSHSEDMERLNFFDHTSPVAGKSSPWDRAKLAGTEASGENIARGQRDGSSANQAWWHSPGHHRNMLGSHHRIGLGRAGVNWTEMFGG